MKQIKKNPISLVLLAAAILISRYLPESSQASFFAGLFTGLSLVLNICSVYFKFYIEIKAE